MFFGYQEILPHAASTFQEVILEQSLKVRISFPTLIYALVLSFRKVFSLDLCIFEFVRVSCNSNPCNYLLTKFLSLQLNVERFNSLSPKFIVWIFFV